MSIRAFFSGVESEQHFQVCQAMGVKWMLMSYYQFFDKNPDLLKQRKKKYPDVQYFLDSGAHTFADADNIQNKFSKWRLPDFESYLQGYVAWLKKYKGYYWAAADFDIYAPLDLILGGNYSSRIGVSIVEGWHQKYFKPLVEEGYRINFVWHEELSIDGWERLCTEFPYVGLPGEMSKHSDFNRFISTARKFTTQVHGYGAFKPVDFRDAHYFSVDATSWKAAEEYGLLIHWTQDHRLIMENDKLKWPKYRTEISAKGFDGAAITENRPGSYKEKTRYAIYSFQEMERFYNARLKGRMFYYNLRLPHPLHILGKMSDKNVFIYWKRFRPAQLFKQHAEETNPATIKHYLCAMAAVQYRVVNWFNLHKLAQSFMQAYFPQIFTPVPSDIGVAQRELSSYIAPPNPPALTRELAEHWIPTNPPKARDTEWANKIDLREDYDLEALPAFR